MAAVVVVAVADGVRAAAGRTSTGMSLRSLANRVLPDDDKADLLTDGLAMADVDVGNVGASDDDDDDE